MRFKRVATLLLSIAVLVASMLASTARAQDADGGRLNLTTSPLPIKLLAEQGETISTDLRVKNSGNAPERLKVGLMKFSAFGEEGKPLLADREEGDTYFDWVSFSENEFDAEPNVWKTIKMTIEVPPEGAFGYYYAVTFSRTSPADRGEESAGVEGAAAVLVLLEVNAPGAKKALELREFRTNRGIYEFLPVEFRVRLQNTGNIHVSPSGTIFITKGGEEIEQIALNSAGGSVLPESTREFTTNWASGFPKYIEKVEDSKTVRNDKGETQYSLQWDWGEAQNLRFGKYSATLVAAYDDGSRDVPLEATVTFWVIPWRIVAFGLLIAAAVGIGVFTVIRRLWRGVRTVANKRNGKI